MEKDLIYALKKAATFIGYFMMIFWGGMIILAPFALGGKDYLIGIVILCSAPVYLFLNIFLEKRGYYNL